MSEGVASAIKSEPVQASGLGTPAVSSTANLTRDSGGMVQTALPPRAALYDPERDTQSECPSDMITAKNAE